jgi:diguanylate cyclase
MAADERGPLVFPCTFSASRRHLTATLSQQREHFEVTLASIGDAVITTDRQGRVTFLNPVAESLTGWSSADAVGKEITI